MSVRMSECVVHMNLLCVSLGIIPWHYNMIFITLCTKFNISKRLNSHTNFKSEDKEGKRAKISYIYALRPDWREEMELQKEGRKEIKMFVRSIRFHFSSATWCSLSFELPRLSFQLEQLFVFLFLFIYFFTVPS